MRVRVPKCVLVEYVTCPLMRAYAVCIVVRVPVLRVYYTPTYPPSTCRTLRTPRLSLGRGGGTLRYLLSPMTFDTQSLVASLSNVIVISSSVSATLSNVIGNRLLVSIGMP